MALTRNEVKSIFLNALTRVANFNNSDPDIEENTFTNFHNFHKIVLLTAIKGLMHNRTFTYYGKIYCYDITLNENMYNQWATFGDCIDYIENFQLEMEREDNINL